MITITSVLYYAGYVNYLLPLYLFLSMMAIFTTFRLDRWVKMYPHINSQYKEAVELIFDKTEYKLRLYNFIGSYLCHAIIVGVLIGNMSVLFAISAVAFYRVMSLVMAYNKIKEYRNE